jgi:hypothetical protein
MPGPNEQAPNPQEAPISDPPPSESDDVHDPVEPQPVDETDATAGASELAHLS